MKKYVQGKNVNFNYIFEDSSPLYSVILFTAQDKDAKRFVEFLDFFVKHGFDIQILNNFKGNLLFESLIVRNFNAFKVLLKRGVNPKCKDRKGRNLLQRAEESLKYNRRVMRFSKDERGINAAKKSAKKLEKQFIPYLKSLKDPKTGKPLFKE